MAAPAAPVPDEAAGSASNPAGPSDRPRFPWKPALLLFGLALAIRGLVLLRTATIGVDGPQYVWTAELFRAGRIEEALGKHGGIHPLYPALTAAVGLLGVPTEAAGYAVSILAGSAVCFPLLFLALQFWSRRVAVLTCVLYALHSPLAIEGAEVNTTSTYLLFFVSSVAFLLAAIRVRSRLCFALAGLAAGLAVLTRAEGIPLALSFGGVAAGFTAWRILKRDAGWKRLAAGSAVALLLLFVVIQPYWAWVHRRTSGWLPTTRSSAAVVFEKDGPSPSIPDPESTDAGAAGKGALVLLTRRILRAAHPLTLALLIPAILIDRRRTPERQGMQWLTAASILFALPPIAVFLVNPRYEPAYRYFLSSTCLVLPIAASGLWGLAERVSTRTKRPAIGLATVAVAGLLLFLQAAQPRRPNESSYREAARWVREQPVPAARRIVCSNPKIAYYSGFEHLTMPSERLQPPESSTKIYETGEVLVVPTPVHDCFSYFRYQNASYIVLLDRQLKNGQPGFQEELGRLGMVEVARFPRAPGTSAEEVRILRRIPGRQKP